MSKVSWNDAMVSEIKKELSSGIKQINLSRKFNVSKSIISRIFNNVTWRHI